MYGIYIGGYNEVAREGPDESALLKPKKRGNTICKTSNGFVQDPVLLSSRVRRYRAQQLHLFQERSYATASPSVTIQQLRMLLPLFNPIQ